MPLENKTNIRPPKIAVVLGAGGLKSAAGIALIQFLQEEKIPIDLVVSSGTGSALAVLWGMGYSVAQIKEAFERDWTKPIFKKLDYRSILSMLKLPFGKFSHSRGILKSEGIDGVLAKHCGQMRLEDLQHETVVMATDLFSGAPARIEKGLLRQAVKASTSSFPMLPACEIDNQWLIHGAYSSPLPILEALKRQMDLVIVCSVEEKSQYKSKSFLHYLFRTQRYIQHATQKNQIALAMAMYEHEVVFVNSIFDDSEDLNSANRLPNIYEIGSRAVEKARAEIFEALEQYYKVQSDRNTEKKQRRDSGD